jgi:hypothetical protein
MGVVRHVIPGAVQAAECLLNHVLGRLPVPEHEKREPGQPQRMPLVDRGDRLAGAHLAVRRVTVPAVPAWCHGFGDRCGRRVPERPPRRGLMSTYQKRQRGPKVASATRQALTNDAIVGEQIARR